MFFLFRRRCVISVREEEKREGRARQTPGPLDRVMQMFNTHVGLCVCVCVQTVNSITTKTPLCHLHTCHGEGGGKRRRKKRFSGRTKQTPAGQTACRQATAEMDGPLSFTVGTNPDGLLTIFITAAARTLKIIWIGMAQMQTASARQHWRRQTLSPARDTVVNSQATERNQQPEQLCRAPALYTALAALHHRQTPTSP